MAASLSSSVDIIMTLHSFYISLFDLVFNYSQIALEKGAGLSPALQYWI